MTRQDEYHIKQKTILAIRDPIDLSHYDTESDQYTVVLFCFYYGLAIGTSVLCAQYWGKGDKHTVERIIGLASKIVLLISSSKSSQIRFRTEYMLKRLGVLFKDFLKISAPFVINDLVWRSGDLWEKQSIPV